MTKHLREFLEAEKVAAAAELQQLLEIADVQAKVHNGRRQMKRYSEGKRSRNRSMEWREYNIPDRVGAYDAYARLLAARRLLDDFDLFEFGEMHDVFASQRSRSTKMVTERQTSILTESYRKHLNRFEAIFKREMGRDTARAEADIELTLEGLYAALLMRVQALRHALRVLETTQVGDRLAATIYLRDSARLLALERFLSSERIADRQDLSRRSFIYKQQVPDKLLAYGARGKEVWGKAIDDLEVEALNILRNS